MLTPSSFMFFHQGARFDSDELEFVSFTSVLRFVGDVMEPVLFFENIDFDFSSQFKFPEFFLSTEFLIR